MHSPHAFSSDPSLQCCSPSHTWLCKTQPMPSAQGSESGVHVGAGGTVGQSTSSSPCGQSCTPSHSWAGARQSGELRHWTDGSWQAGVMTAECKDRGKFGEAEGEQAKEHCNLNCLKF